MSSREALLNPSKRKGRGFDSRPRHHLFSHKSLWTGSTVGRAAPHYPVGRVPSMKYGLTYSGLAAVLMVRLASMRGVRERFESGPVHPINTHEEPGKPWALQLGAIRADRMTAYSS